MECTGGQCIKIVVGHELHLDDHRFYTTNNDHALYGRGAHRPGTAVPAGLDKLELYAA
jgi:hypothetical protein